MTYSADFRTQVIKSVKQQDMSIRQACVFYSISKTTLQRWHKNPSNKESRNEVPIKIPDDVLLKDVEQHPDDYLYEQAHRLNCSNTGIHNALKRLAISQKKDFRALKSLSGRKNGVSK